MYIYIYCEYILLSTGISIYSFFALNTIEYIYVLFNIPLAYMIWSSSKLEIPFWRMLVWLWHKDSLKFSGRVFFATVTGVFCDGWVIPDSNVFFLRRRRLQRGFLRQFTRFFATVLGFFATVLAAEVFLGVSHRSTVEEEEKESRRMRSRGGGGGWRSRLYGREVWWQRGLIASIG